MKIKLVKFNKKFITTKYISWLNNKKLVKYSDQRLKKHTYESCKLYFQNAKRDKDLFFAIVEKNTKKHVGNIYVKMDKVNNTGDIRILIGESKKGYGFDAWNSAIKVLKKMNIRKITGGTISINKAMIKIFKKSKMKFEYRKIKYYKRGNKFYDLIGYCLFT